MNDPATIKADIENIQGVLKELDSALNSFNENLLKFLLQEIELQKDAAKTVHEYDEEAGTVL